MGEQFGHVKLSRKAFLKSTDGGDPFWNEPREFSRWEAWEYLIQAAAWKDHTWTVNGQPVPIARGETRPLSVRYLAVAWRWSKSKVERFLNTLSEMERIRTANRYTDGDTYVIVNYDTYQGERDTDGDSGGTAAGQRRDKREAGKAGKAGKADTEGAAQRKPSARPTALPTDFEPSDAHREMARTLGVSLADELEQFRDYHAAKGSTMKDWPAAFRTWLRNAKKFSAPSGRQPDATIIHHPGDRWKTAMRDEDAAHAAWEAEVEPLLRAEPSEVKREITAAAEADCAATKGHQWQARFVRAACLKRYGERIGNPQPGAVRGKAA